MLTHGIFHDFSFYFFTCIDTVLTLPPFIDLHVCFRIYIFGAFLIHFRIWQSICPSLFWQGLSSIFSRKAPTHNTIARKMKFT